MRLRYAASSLFLAPLLLLGCSGAATQTYELTLVMEDDKTKQELIDASLRVIERRLGSLEATLVNQSVDASGEKPRITIEATPRDALEALTTDLMSPFDVQVMAEAPEEEADIVIEGHGGFKKTAVTGEDFAWVLARANPATNTGEVQLQFTEQGKADMQQLFSSMQGKSIGLFVRGQLVSKLQVAEVELGDVIDIRDIPTSDLAFVFADDMNVGLHVTFTPVSQ